VDQVTPTGFWQGGVVPGVFYRQVNPLMGFEDSDASSLKVTWQLLARHHILFQLFNLGSVALQKGGTAVSTSSMK
jgi:hypothetical protein